MFNRKKYQSTQFRRINKIKKNGKYSKFSSATKIIKNDLNNFFLLVPSHITQLGSAFNTIESNFATELVWSCNLLIAHSKVIKTFLLLKEEYSASILSGNFESATDTLNNIEANCGWSVWLVEAKFFCKQKLEGLEGNKNLLSNIYQLREVNDEFEWIYYLSFLISERNEDGCDVGAFSEKLHSVISSISDRKFRDEVKNIVNYYIFNDLPSNEDNNGEYLISLIRFTQKLSAIDIYEFIIRVLVELSHKNYSNDLKLPIRIIDIFDDYRCDNIKFHLNLQLKKESKQEANELSSQNLTSLRDPFLNLFLKIGISIKSNNEFINNYINVINSFLNLDEKFIESLLALTQLSVNLKHIDDIYSLIDIPATFSTYDKRNKILKLSKIYSKDKFEIIDEEVQLKFNLDKKDSDNVSRLIKLDHVYDLLNQGVDTSSVEMETSSSYIKIYSSTLIVDNLICQNDFANAFKLFVDNYIQNENFNILHKIADTVKTRSWRFYKKIGAYLDSSIVLYSYLSHFTDDKQLFNAKACWRSFLNECNVIKPSELNLYHFSGDKNRYFFFLYRVCSSLIMEHDANNYRNTRDLITERIAICDKLSQDFDNEEIAVEKNELERSLAIADGLNEVDTAGLTIDQERFRRAANSRFLNVFERYKTFLYLGHNQNERKNTSNYIVSEKSLFQKPFEESNAILVRLLHELADVFLKNHEFGLDYYLSMRIRHGRFMGVCRGPLERRKLITKYSDSKGGYRDNEYWIKKLSNTIEFESLKDINNTLISFSEEIDKELSRFVKEEIQIFSEECPLGAFKIDITQALITILRESINSSTTMDNFLDYVIEYFFLSIDTCSVKIKENINKTFRTKLNEKLQDLQKDVDVFLGGKRCSKAIIAEIIASRTEINRTLEDVSTWFDVSSEIKQSIKIYTFEDIVEISMARTKMVYQSFEPNLSITNSEYTAEFHSNSLATMVDALTLLLSNIKVHGKSNCPDVLISASDWVVNKSSAKFKVSFSNPIEEQFVDFKKLDKIKNEISLENRKARQEGGSGFHKLVAMPLIESHKDLTFDYINGMFKVDIVFSLISIGEKS